MQSQLLKKDLSEQIVMPLYSRLLIADVSCSIEAEDAKDQTPFAGVRLGPLVGKGSFGKVYRGIWDHMIVAIKVRKVLTVILIVCNL